LASYPTNFSGLTSRKSSPTNCGYLTSV